MLVILLTLAFLLTVFPIFLRGVSFFMGGRRVEEISGFSEYFSHPTIFSQNFFIPHQKLHENFRTPTMSESFSYPNNAVKFFIPQQCRKFLNTHMLPSPTAVEYRTSNSRTCISLLPSAFENFKKPFKRKK